MAAKTLDDFYKEYRSGFNIITGEPNLFKDLTDGMVWDAAIKSVVENGSSYNSAMPKFCPYHKSNAQCIWGLRGFCKVAVACEVRAELRQ